MNTATTQAQQRIADAATNKTDAVSLKLYHLTEIVKLAAFAAEARQTLEEIQNAAHSRPEMKKVISNISSNWLEMENATGNVLSYVAEQLQEVNGEFTDTVHGLARATRNGGVQ